MRHLQIDILKGLLTIQMVLAHSLQFFTSLEPGSPEHWVSEYVNLTTFSGFFFAFGYVSWLAYLQKPFKAVWKNLLKNAFRLLVAYYISAAAFRIIHDEIFFDPDSLTDILLFRTIPGYSEFLLSFALLIAMILLFQPLMRHAGKWLVPIIVAISIASAFVDVTFSQPLLNSIVGRSEFFLFPVLPYSLYFASGIYIAQNPDFNRWWALFVSLTGTLAFIVTAVRTGIPSRFPPSIYYIVGGLLFVYIYYLFSLFLAKHHLAAWLTRIGRESLFYLILSNCIIFTVKASRFYRIDPLFAISMFFIVTTVICYLSSLIKREQISRISAPDNGSKHDDMSSY